MKNLILILIGLLWLAACSPLPGSGRTKPELVFQPTKDLTSLSSTSLASTEDQGTVNNRAIFGNWPGELVTVAGEPPAGSQNSTVIDTSEPVATASVALLQEINDLSAQRRADLVPAVSGWVHLITRQIHSKVTFFSAWDNSNGQYQQEEWLYLDDQGLVRADIKRVVSYQGHEGEFTLLSGGTWTNLYPATQNSASNTLPFDPNYGTYELFAYLLKQGQTLNKSTLYKECWYLGEKYSITDGRIIHEVLFRPDYHTLRWIKTWQVSAGGITLVDSIEIALEERLPKPPDDILILMAQTTP